MNDLRRHGTGPVLLAPHGPVNLAAPDISRWLAGNGGVPAVWSFASSVPGPHAAVVAVVHGNEIAGAILLDRWLDSGLRPLRGRLTLIFCNIDAYRRFDPADPAAARFVEEDMNRVWHTTVLDGPRKSSELVRARALRPVIDSVDTLLDLHSVTWPSDPLIIGGRNERGALLGLEIGVPPLTLVDDGHVDGERLLDYRHFSDEASSGTGVLLEAGPHFEPDSVVMMEQCATRFLHRSGMIADIPARDPALAPPRLARTTRTVTARTDNFVFVREFRGGEVIGKRNTIIALDGETEIRTPHDNCLLVMPTPHAPAGHTAVRLARFDDR